MPVFDDDEIQEIIEEALELCYDPDDQNEFDDIADEELDSFGVESLFQVSCRGGCGTFGVDEVNVLDNPQKGLVEWRCPVCNSLQTTDLLILD